MSSSSAPAPPATIMSIDIEQIVRNQQELMSDQRKQKAIQRETSKLLATLNRNIQLMSDRLDQFAARANMKLESGGGGLDDNSRATLVLAGTAQPFHAFQQTQQPQSSSGGSATVSQMLANKLVSPLKSNSVFAGNGQRPSSAQNRVAKLLDATNTPLQSRNFFVASTDFANAANQASAISMLSDDNNNTTANTNEEERETIQSKKKPKKLQHSLHSNRLIDNQQRLFNKFVRESVEERLGKEFLLMHEIQAIEQDTMEAIKKEALAAYPPINIRPRRAWHLAKASLRCRRRSLRRQKEKTVEGTGDMNSSGGSTSGSLAANSSSSSGTISVGHFSLDDILTNNALISL